MSDVEDITCLENEEQNNTQRSMVNDIYKKTMTFGEAHSLYSGLLEERPFLVFSENLWKVYISWVR
jgi:hypothetical protein